MRRNGGPVFPAHANPGDPNGPLRGLAANETACALISMMARSTLLQAEAGYIDARPQRRQIEKFSCDARPDHTLGQTRRIRRGAETSGRPLIAAPSSGRWIGSLEPLRRPPAAQQPPNFRSYSGRLAV